ncbi:hypothetical protein ZWY2020_057106 [Hordeum vulgare]|nr:hypothetical protein ZWY2020_057106 [Hordeum vulgare]
MHTAKIVLLKISSIPENGGQQQVLWCSPKALGEWGAQIHNPISGKKQCLGTFNFVKEAAHAYDAKALEYQGQSRAQLNFHEDASHASEIAPPNITIVSKAKEREHLKAEALLWDHEHQSTNPSVERHLREHSHLYGFNEVFLVTERNQNDVEDDPLDWDDLAKKDKKN